MKVGYASAMITQGAMFKHRGAIESRFSSAMFPRRQSWWAWLSTAFRRTRAGLRRHCIRSTTFLPIPLMGIYSAYRSGLGWKSVTPAGILHTKLRNDTLASDDG
jgi:hypothetical protein